MSQGARRLVRYLRYAHLYLAMLGSLLICFFAVTGLVLNHEDFFTAGASEESETEKPARPDLLKEPIDMEAIEAMARREFAVRGGVTSANQDESYIEMTFERPGYRADLTIDREAKSIRVYARNDGALSALIQLHRGRHAPTGKWWPWVVDAAAVLLIIASLTGIGLLLSLKHHRAAGLAAATTGVALAVVAYFLLVP